MKMPLLILFALGAGLSPMRAAADPSEFSLLDWLGTAVDQPPALKKGERRAASPEALCKEVEVPVDEGYGVSARERRVVCEDDR
jgi:hypothetical protein